MKSSQSIALLRLVGARPRVRLIACLILCLALRSTIAPESSWAAAFPSPAGTAIPAKTWAQDAAATEIGILLHSGSYIRYRQHTIDAKGDELRDVAESKDGTVARLIMRDNRPLTVEEDKAERDRLNSLIEHPTDFARHIKNEGSGKKIAVDLIKLMPDAMIYTYATDQTPAAGGSGPQVVLDYSPDPKFNAPTTASEALSGLRGRIWIDTKSKTIVRMTGDVFQGVNLGWGMVAHIYPGSMVDFEQTEAVGERWNVTVFHEHVTVKALLVKTIKVNTEMHVFDFQQLPDGIRYQDAVRLLLDTPLPR